MREAKNKTKTLHLNSKLFYFFILNKIVHLKTLNFQILNKKYSLQFDKKFEK